MAPNIQYPWLFSNMETSYPFVPQVLPSYLSAIFVDAYIVDGTNLRVDADPINEPLRLVQFGLTDASTAGLMQLQYVNDGSLFFFDNTSPTTEYRVWDFGDWKIVSAENQTERKYVRLVLYTPNIPSYPFTLSLFVDGLEATFVARVHEQNLPKVYSIEVTDAETGITHELSGDLDIYPGYNMAFSVGNQKVESQSFNNSDKRLLTPVTMAAEPGSGEGRRSVDCEEEAEAIRQVNFVQPDSNGNLQLKMDGTLRVNYHYSGTGTVISRAAGELDLDNDGAACCTCEDYGDAYDRILEVQSNAADVADSAKSVRSDHCDVVTDMTAALAEREQKNIKLMVVPKSAWIVNVMIIFNNNPKCEANAPPTTVSFSTPACDGSCTLGTDYELVPGSPHVYNQGEDSTWRKTTITSPTTPGVTAEVIPGNSYMVLSYEVLFINKEQRDCDQPVTINVSSPWGSASKEVNLICPLRDPDPDDCSDVTAYPE